MNALPDKVPFIDPTNILEMTEEQIDAMLDVIREHRLRALRVYKQAEAEKEQKAYDKAAESLAKQAQLLEGNIARMDKALDALNKRINNIRALRLQMGLPVE